MALSDHIRKDTPTNNFATLNPLGTSTATFSEGNLKGNLSVTNGAASATMAAGSGKYYWEILGSSYSNNGMCIGVRNTDNPSSGTYNADGVFYYANDGSIYTDGSLTDTVAAAFGVNDIIGVAIDLDADTVKFYKNNSLQITKSLPQTGKTWHPQFGEGTSSGNNAFLANFGQDPTFGGAKSPTTTYTDANGIGSFYYEPPSGALALCTANLEDFTPNVDGDVPEDYMKSVTYVGNGAATSTGASNTISIGMPADLIWIKERDSTSVNHHIVDTVRGIGTGRYNSLASNTTNPQQTSQVYNGVIGGVTDIDHTNNEFTVHGRTGWVGGDVNELSKNFIAWCWKAGGAPSADGVAMVDGTATTCSAIATAASASITPTRMSVNTKAGFSIVKYTGTGSAATVPHGLSSAPEIVIARTIDASVNWPVWAYPHSVGSTNWLALNSNIVPNPSANTFNGTDPTSSVFSVGSGGTTNASGDAHIAYCWHSVAGYSKFGSYTGNGSTDGPFVYTGFRVGWLLVRRVDKTQQWYIIDSARNEFNVTNKRLVPNQSLGEDEITVADFTSNGFKIRNTSGGINDGTDPGTYIYAAFAEQPFKYANAR